MKDDIYLLTYDKRCLRSDFRVSLEVPKHNGQVGFYCIYNSELYVSYSIHPSKRAKQRTRTQGTAFPALPRLLFRVCNSRKDDTIYLRLDRCNPIT